VWGIEVWAAWGNATSNLRTGILPPKLNGIEGSNLCGPSNFGFRRWQHAHSGNVADHLAG